MTTDGDREHAFEQFYDAHFDAVRRYAARHFGDTNADDIAQDTMLRAYAQFDTLDAGRPARPWLMRVARNLGIDRIRRDRHVPVERGMLEDYGGTVADPAEQVSLRVDVGGVLDQAMSRMSAGDRRVLVLREVCGFAAGDIAGFLGTSNAAIRQRMVRARRSLTHHYLELGGTQYPALVVFRDAVFRPLHRFSRAVAQRAVPLDAPAERTAAAVAAVVIAATLGVPAEPARPPGPPAVTAPANDPARPFAATSLAAPVDVTGLTRPVTGRLDRVTPGTVPAFEETFETAGLPGWTVSGTTATRTCATGAAGCSLALAPDGVVTLSQPVGVALGPQTVLSAYLNVPGGGDAGLTVRAAFDTGESLRVSVAPGTSTHVVLESSSGDRSSFALSAPGSWRAIVVAIDRNRRLATVGSAFTVPLDSVRLRTTPARVESLTIEARGARTSFGVDTVAIGRTPECMDGIDNDRDGYDDLDDPACGSYRLRGESPDPACADGLDNDGDGLTDWPQDPGCYFRDRTSESPSCSDGADNDADGLADFPADPNCEDPTDGTEIAKCADGLDNDDDGAADFPAEPGCTSADDDTERACVTAAATAPVTAKRTWAGLCLDPIEEIARVRAVRDRPATGVIGWLAWYAFGPAKVPCVVTTEYDACAAAGGHLVERDGFLVRADVEGTAGADPAGSMGLCAAHLTVVLWDQNDPPRSRLVVTPC